MAKPAPLVSGVDFVHLATKDFEAAVQFYGTVLGLPLTSRYGEHPGAEFETGNLTLQVMESESFGLEFHRAPNLIALHVDDVEAARAEAGVTRRRVQGRHNRQRRLSHGVLRGSGRQCTHAPSPVRAPALELISERGENGPVVWTDAQTEAELLEILERFCSGFAARDADGVIQLFAPGADVVMVTSEDSLLRGPDEVRAFLHHYAQGTTKYSWTWTRRDVSSAGAVGWLLAEGTETVAGEEREEKHPYRMSMVCEKRDGRWLVMQVHGSFSAPRIERRTVGQTLIRARVPSFRNGFSGARHCHPFGRSTGGSHGDDDLSPGVALFEVPDGRGDFAQRIRPVDDRRDLPRLDELLHDLQVLPAAFRFRNGLSLWRTNGDSAIALIDAATGPNQRPRPFPAAQDERPLRGERAPEVRRRAVSRQLEDEIVLLPAPGEVLLGVVDDVVRAERADQVHVPRAAHAGHLRSERLRDLHREGAHASRRAVDQDLLPWLDPSRGREDPAGRSTRPAGRPPPARTSGWPVSAPRGLPRRGRTRRSRRVTTSPNTSSPGRNRVTFLPTASTCPATSLPRTRFFGLRSPTREADDVRRASHEVPVAGIGGGGADAHQHLVIFDDRLVDFLDSRTSGEP